VKQVYVDASDKKKLITIVINGEKRTLWDSTENYGRNLTSHESEFLGIINALECVQGDLSITCDNESVVKMLNGESKVRRKNKPFIEKIQNLCEGRHIEFKHEKRDINKASLKQEGFSLEEINNPILRKWRLDLREHLTAKHRKTGKMKGYVESAERKHDLRT
jgi:ribonuclease HI